MSTVSNRRRIVLLAAMLVLIETAWHLVPADRYLGIGLLYVLPTGLASWWFGRKAGLLVAGAGALLYASGASIRGTDSWLLASAIRAVLFTATALVVSVLRDRTHNLEATTQELETLRAALTPDRLPEHPGVDGAALFVPAKHGVSGDFYLLTNASDGWNVLVVGDVLGHGVHSAQVATYLRTSIMSFCAGSSDPGEILTLADQALRSESARHFATVVCLAHNPDGHKIRWALAGHWPPIRLPQLTEITSGPFEPPLGTGRRATPYTTHFFEVQPPEGLFLYTDGLIEAAGPDDERFGMSRLRAALAGCGEMRSGEIVEHVRRALEDFAGEQYDDDVCLLAFRTSD